MEKLEKRQAERINGRQRKIEKKGEIETGSIFDMRDERQKQRAEKMFHDSLKKVDSNKEKLRSALSHHQFLLETLLENYGPKKAENIAEYEEADKNKEKRLKLAKDHLEHLKLMSSDKAISFLRSAVMHQEQNNDQLNLISSSPSSSLSLEFSSAGSKKEVLSPPDESQSLVPISSNSEQSEVGSEIQIIKDQPLHLLSDEELKFAERDILLSLSAQDHILLTNRGRRLLKNKERNYSGRGEKGVWRIKRADKKTVGHLFSGKIG